MSTWVSDDQYPGTLIAATENGWMTSDVFYNWFCKFAERNTQRPLLLIMDGHSTHLNLKLIRKAREENITLLKLPAHTTDRLQPLDVCCFGPLKKIWDRTITDWSRRFQARRIQKSEFITLVGNVWNRSFTPENILAGFKKCGIYPVDRTVYPRSVFVPSLLVTYDNWKAEQIRMREAPMTPSSTPRRAALNPTEDLTPRQPQPPLNIEPQSASSSMPAPPVEQSTTAAGLSISASSSIPATPATSLHSSFELLLCSTFHTRHPEAGKVQSTTRKTGKRYPCNAEVLTGDEVIEQQEASKKNKGKKRSISENTKNETKCKKQPSPSPERSSSSSDNEQLEPDYDDSSDTSFTEDQPECHFYERSYANLHKLIKPESY